MRTASVCLLTLAFGCSSSADEPGGVGGAQGFSAGSGGVSVGTAGQMAQAGAGNGGAPSGGNAGAGQMTGGSNSGGSGTGVSGGGAGGRSNGGAGGSAGGASTAGSAGAAGCVPNLACKLSPPPSSGDLHQDCVNRINQFLTQCACLPALTRRTDGEACANQMAEYDAEMNEPHAGARANICQPGGSQNECPRYASNAQVIGLCMQQMWDEGPPPTSSCTGACYEEHGHFINMTDKNVTKVACGFYTTSSGDVWAVQNFSR